MNDRLKLDPQFESLMPAVPFSRRGFLISSAATGFALSAGPIMAQQAVSTSADGLQVGEVQVPAKDGQKIPAYFAAPSKAARYPVILVIPEVFGMHEYQKDICRRLAKVGYFAITSDPFFRKGDLSKISDIKEVLAAANTLTDEQVFADLDSVVDWSGKHAKANIAKLGITGMCRGGRTVWQYTGHNPKIKAGVAWYGGLHPMPPNSTNSNSPLDTADKLNAPVLGLYGGADQGIPQNMVDRMNAALLAFGKDKQSMIHVYPDMPHAFHADYRPSYRKEAAEDGWKRMLAWFKKHGVA